MKRIFVAIPISEKLQEGIFEFEKDFLSNRPAFAKATAGKIRWMSGKNLHVTLIPPWEDDDIENIKNQISKIKNSGIKPFDITFKRVNFGPNPHSPRLIWAENSPPRPAVELRDELSQLLNKDKDYRKWTMHITLARFDPKTFSSFPVKQLDEEIWWPERVNSIVIMESHLRPDGADYETLHEIKLE